MRLIYNNEDEELKKIRIEQAKILKNKIKYIDYDVIISSIFIRESM